MTTAADPTIPQPARVCNAQYERPGGRQPGDRIVECDRDLGHWQPHWEGGTGFEWADTPEPSTPPATGDSVKCSVCYGLVVQTGSGWEHVGGDPECCPDPEPAPETPAQNAATVPAGPDPHPDTPGAAQAVTGVLGRALMDADGDPWSVQDRASAKVYGPVREVLLVTAPAARVIDAAQAWRAVRRRGGYDSGPCLDDLAAAVDALGGDHPAEQPTGQCGEAFTAYGGEFRCVEPARHEGAHQNGLGAEWLGAPSDHPAEPATTGGPDHDGLTGHPAEPAPEPDAQLCGAWYRVAGRDLVCTREAGHGAFHDQIEPAPEPAGGWDREAIDELRDQLAADNDPAVVHLCALLADRDRLAGLFKSSQRIVKQLKAEVDRLRAELATARRDAAREVYDRVTAALTDVRRDAAADALADAATRFVKGSAPAFAAARWAAEYRRRPVPGSPEPAPAGGEAES